MYCVLHVDNAVELHLSMLHPGTCLGVCNWCCLSRFIADSSKCGMRRYLLLMAESCILFAIFLAAYRL
jgi:hypothetical protein